VDTGDIIERIDGVFSRILSFFFNSFARTEEHGGMWSAEVQKGMDLGYKVPDPRDDLNRLGVTRKLAVLARLSSLPVQSHASFPVPNLIPKELERRTSGDEFMQKLHEYDSRMEEIKSTAEKKGKGRAVRGKY